MPYTYSADLHSHTLYSDGSADVAGLLKMAENAGLSHFAVTDHDCLDGADEAKSILSRVKVIYGIELSTFYRGDTVHVLGYFGSGSAPGMKDLLERQRLQRRRRALDMMDLIEQHFGICLDRNEAYSRSSITRGTLAEIIARDTSYTKQEVFDVMLGSGCPCYIPSTKMDTAEGIDIIRSCGGIPVLAHPCLIKQADPAEVAALGVDGIEAVYPAPENDERRFRELAASMGLFVTAGSDFHRPDDGKHGNVGQCRISGDDLDRFLEITG